MLAVKVQHDIRVNGGLARSNLRATSLSKGRHCAPQFAIHLPYYETHICCILSESRIRQSCFTSTLDGVIKVA